MVKNGLTPEDFNDLDAFTEWQVNAVIDDLAQSIDTLMLNMDGLSPDVIHDALVHLAREAQFQMDREAEAEGNGPWW